MPKTKHNTRNPFHRKSEAQMGQGENRPKAQKIEKKNKETSKICDSDLLTYEVDVRCRRANWRRPGRRRARRVWEATGWRAAEGAGPVHKKPISPKIRSLTGSG
jgi:hypothetical protein